MEFGLAELLLERAGITVESGVFSECSGELIDHQPAGQSRAYDQYGDDDPLEHDNFARMVSRRPDLFDRFFPIILLLVVIGRLFIIIFDRGRLAAARGRLSGGCGAM